MSGYRLPEGMSTFLEWGTCKECRCWYHETEKQPDGSVRLKYAECRRKSPQGEMHQGVIFGEWPRIGPDEWCGEFRP